MLTKGDYRDCTLVVWSTHNYSLLAASKSAQPIHDLSWDPYTTNEFSSVGETGTLLFWMLDETQGRFSLNVHEAGVPQDLMDSKHMVRFFLNCIFSLKAPGTFGYYPECVLA